MPFSLSARSKDRLKGVHKDLRRVVMRALTLSRVDFTVLEGLRTKERQLELFKRGASKLQDSRHMHGMAVDLAPLEKGQVSWHWPEYIVLAAAMKHAAILEGVHITWGGDWPHFRDGPHFELNRDFYSDPA